MNIYIPFLSLILLLLPVSGIAQRPPTKIFVADVQQTLLSEEIEALGTLKASEDVELTSTVTALITKIHFVDGQRVSRGEVLVEMDAEEELSLKAEELSRLNEAQKQLARLQPLVSRGAAARSTLDEAEMVLLTIKARIEALDARISKRQITAPFDGVVGLRNISVGALAQPGMLLCTIDNDNTMKLDFSVPAVFLSSLTPPLKVVATSKAFPQETFTGELSSVDSRINPDTRAVMVRARLDNSDGRLIPGLLMGITLSTASRQSLTIPEQAIIFTGEKKSVFVVADSVEGKTVRSAVIETGVRRQGKVEVLSGLGLGDQVVTHGITRIRPGVRISIQAKDFGEESLSQLLQQKTVAVGPEGRG